MVPAVQRSRETLARVMSFRDYVAMGFGVMVGVGWVVYAGQWLESGGSLGAILAFAIGGVCLIPVGKCYGELAAAIPVSGGAVAFNYKAFGPFTSYLTSWLLLLSYVAVVPFETIAAGAMFEAMFPSLATAPLYTVGGYRVSWSTILPGLAAAAWVIWLGWFGTKGSARFQTIVLYAKILATVAFSAVAFWQGSAANLEPWFGPGSSNGVGTWAAIASVLVIVPFFMAGFDCIPQTAEEAGARMNPRELGVAIVTTIVVGASFYILIVLALGWSVPGDELGHIVAEKDRLPMAEVFRRSFGFEWAAKIVLFAALTGVLSTLNGMFMTSTRLLFAQGRAELLPSWFCRLHPTYRTPTNAIVVVGVLALAGPFVGKAGLTYIVNCGSLIFVMVAASVVVATLRLRQNAPGLVRPYRISPPTIWAAIAVCFALLGLMLVPGSPGQVGRGEVAALAVWITLGLAVRFWWVRRRRTTEDERGAMLLGEFH